MPLFLFLGWFASHFLFNNLVGRAERTDIVLWSLVECAFVLLIMIVVLCSNFMRKPAFPVRGPGDKWILGILGAWILLTLIATWIGWWNGNQPGYLWGDLYRFGSLSVILGLLYFSGLTLASFQRLLRGFVLVYGTFLIVDAFLYASAAVEGIRPATQSAAYAGIVAPLVIYVALLDPKRVFRTVSRLVLLEMLGAMIAAQMFTPIISVLFCLGLFLLPMKKPSLVIGLMLGLGALFVSVYYAGALMNTDLAYLETKVQLASEAYSPQEMVESLSGVRLGEIRSVLNNMRKSPETIPLGAGLGSMVFAETGYVELPWVQYKHYLHSGLNEILYRTGGVGLALFLALVSLLFLRGYRLYRRGHAFGLFVVVAITNVVLLMSFATDLTTGLPILAVCFVGLSLAEGTASHGHTEESRKQIPSEKRFVMGIERGIHVT